MNRDEHFNPFPGPQPYRAADHKRFFGREHVTQRLVNRILARPCVTLFGPSGAGKSSLMQAAVIPLLRQQHDFRTVRIDTWMANETPLERLVRAMFVDLELGEFPQGMSSHEALDEALRLAERYSDRPILIYLDQLERPILPARPPGEADELFERLGALARKPLRGLQLVLSLREDYLGRFRDRVRGQQSLQDPGFRLGPLHVKEMAWVACRLAEVGKPPQHWSEQEMRELMLQVRTPGQAPTQEAEIQAAFAQIVCRALWEERRAAGDKGRPMEAQPILHRYLEATLVELGPLRADARRLLEENLVALDGSRTLLTEREARTVLGEGTAEQVLAILERAAVLRAEEHQGSRYFELGHDWLANKVLELKREREEQHKRQRERSARHKLAVLAVVAAGVALMMGILLLWAVSSQRRAIAQSLRAFDQSMLVGAREQMELDQPAIATRLLLNVRQPGELKGWTALAQEALESNFLELTLPGAGLPLNTAAYSPANGQLLVTGADDGTLLLWRADGSEHTNLGTHGEAVLSAAFSPDGQRIVTASRDGSARVWWADEPGRFLQLGMLHAEQARSAAFSPDGQRIVLASSNGTARVWRADGSALLLELKGHQDGLTSVAFSPDGQRIVTTSWDGTARVWRADGSGQPLVLEGHTGPVLSAAFSPDGELLATALSDGTAQVWRTDGVGEPLVLEGHKGPVRSIAFSPHGKEPLWFPTLDPKDLRIVTASEDGTARVWRADGSGEPLVFEGHEGPVRSAAFSPDGQHIVTAAWDGTARVWRVEDSMRPRILKAHKQPVTFAAVSPDGMFIATASRDKTVKLWHSDGSGPLRTFEGHTGAIMSIAFSPDSQSLVTASRDNTARVWRTGVWQTPPLVLEGHTADVSSAEFSPDGQRILTASWDKTARVWGADGSGPQLELKGHQGRINSATFSPNGQRILTADSTGTVREWQANSGAMIRERAVHGRSVNSVRYSANGQRLVTTSNDGTARVWRADLSEELGVFKGHKGPVYSAAFSPDDQLLVTASNDTTARVWRIDDPKHFNVLKGHAGPVQSAEFSPDGEHIVTASWDRTARRWPLPSSATQTIKELQERLEQDNQDCLSADMRQTYLDESEDQARERYEDCERSHHRDPARAWVSRSE